MRLTQFVSQVIKFLGKILSKKSQRKKLKRQLAQQEQERRIEMYKRVLPSVGKNQKHTEENYSRNYIKNQNAAAYNIMGLARNGDSKKQLQELSAKIRNKSDIVVIPPELEQYLGEVFNEPPLRVIIIPSIITPAVVRSHW